MEPDLIRGSDGRRRCFWGAADEAMQAYHDGEWGFPVTDDRRLFEKLCLEGFQSGLSWRTILLKRPGFRQAFANFDIARVARFDKKKVEALLRDESIVRHRGKIESVLNNARKALDLVEERGSLAAYVWQFEAPASRRRPRVTRASLQATSSESIAMSKDLKRRGFKFVGSTIVYAFMQAVGMVNDHVTDCFRHRSLTRK